MFMKICVEINNKILNKKPPVLLIDYYLLLFKNHRIFYKIIRLKLAEILEIY